ncbi:MAG TPA: hypothetical protein VF288_07510 [Mycobacteriales bacterium]
MLRRACVGCLVAVLSLLLGACGGSSAASHTGTSAPPATTTTGTATAPAGGSTAPSASSSFLMAPGQAAFLTPSGNISCELDDIPGGVGEAAFCETVTPPESASLAADGSVKLCGVGCEGNAGEKTPVLAYGDQVSLGPFRCVSGTGGVTCTAGGKGFEISRSGIAPAGTPPVTLAPGSYSGTVETVSPGAARMTFTIATTGCQGVPSPGTWSVDLTGATFVGNSEPITGQGQAVEISRDEWAQQASSRRAWTVVVATGQPLEVTDGPTC